MRRDLRNGFLVILCVLIVQYLLGMAVNLFVTVPRDHPGASASEYFSGVAQSVTWAILHGHVLLILHASLGLLLVVLGAGVMYRAIRSGARSLVITSVIGAIAILAAGFNGGSYLNYHEDFSSMIMASLFAIAVTAYVVGLWALPPQQESLRPAGR